MYIYIELSANLYLHRNESPRVIKVRTVICRVYSLVHTINNTTPVIIYIENSKYQPQASI